jgi:hypothetical protein
MSQYATTPDNDARRSGRNAHPAKGSDHGGISTADRVALAAMFAVAILVLVLVGLTYRSTAQPLTAAALAAMSPAVDLPAPRTKPRRT